MPTWWRRLAELLALCGLAVVEPVLTAFRDGADVFVTRGADGIDVVGFTLVVVLGLPVLLFGLEALVGLAGRRVQDAVHRVLLGGLLVLVLLRALVDLPGALTALLAVAGGAGLYLATGRWSGVRHWLQLLALFPLLLGAWFLGTEPIRGLLTDPDRAVGEAAEVDHPVPVVLVVLDELPLESILDDDDRIDADQFPNLAGLADDATWFRNATGVSPTTPEAVPPILTGRYPDEVGLLPTVDVHPDNLFTLLRGTYAFHVQESVTHLCPSDLCEEGAFVTGTPVVELTEDAVDLWRRQVFGGDTERSVDFAIRQSDPNAPATIERFVTGMRPPGERPSLDFLHVVYPHQPWFHEPDGSEYQGPFIAEGLDQFDNYSWKTAAAADAGRQRHLLQARHADAMLGTILDRLRDLGSYDDALVVVTADHGAAFEAGEPVRGASTHNVDGVLWVPLLVKAPGQAGGRIDERPARTIDVLPTIADVVGMGLPGGVDGRSLLGPPPDADAPDERRVYDWGFSTLVPNADGYALVDGRQGYEDVLAEPPPGEGDDPELRFYRFGRYGELVGRRADSFDRGAPIALRVDLDDPTRYRYAPPDGQPAYVAGDLGTDPGLDVAVIVNGTVGGWMPVQPDGRFWALVPPQLLRSSGNDVQIAAIEDGGRTLAPLRAP